MLDAVQQRLDKNPQAMRVRRETAEHPFGTTQDADGCNALSDEAPTEGRHRDGAAQLAYNLTRVMNIIDVQPLLAVMRA